MKKDISANTKAITDTNGHVDDLNKELHTIKTRIDNLENITSGSNYDVAVNEAIMEVDRKIQHLRTKADNTKVEILGEAKKIVGIAPVTDTDLDHLLAKGIKRGKLLDVAALDFLTEELK